MRLSTDARTFVGEYFESKMYIVFTTPSPQSEGEVLFSDYSKEPGFNPDTFYVLEGVYREPDYPSVISYKDNRPVAMLGSQIRVEDEESRYQFELGLLKLTEVPNPGHELTIVVPPRDPECEYLLRTEDGMFVYVSTDRNRRGYSAWKLFTGDGVSMYEHQNPRSERYRDGGTTYVSTDEGTFYSPTPFEEGAKATWTVGEVEQTLSVLDKNDYDIVETPEGVSITKK